MSKCDKLHEMYSKCYTLCILLFRITYMITGAPIIGVIAFSGIMPASPGRVVIILHKSAVAEPHRIVSGNSWLWLSEPRINRATCGMARPMKAIGPQ